MDKVFRFKGLINKIGLLEGLEIRVSNTPVPLMSEDNHQLGWANVEDHPIYFEAEIYIRHDDPIRLDLELGHKFYLDANIELRGWQISQKPTIGYLSNLSLRTEPIEGQDPIDYWIEGQ